MRVLAAVLIVGLSFAVAAQEPAPSPPPTPPHTSPELLPQPAPPVGLTPLPLRVTPTPEALGGWRRARIVSVVGTLLSVVGAGLSVASVIYIAATHYPPSTNDLVNPPKPTDTGPVLAYAGSTTSAAGFILTATALGYEHHLLEGLGVDPGRGRFAIGTAIGVLGFLGVGASYFFGLTNFLDPHDQQVTVLATTIGGAALCGVAGLIYIFDSSRNKSVWKSLGTF